MTLPAEKRFVVFADWVETGRFSQPDGALLFQKCLQGAFPSMQVRVFHEDGNTLSLVEGDWRVVLTSAGWKGVVTMNRVKGGDDEMMNGKGDHKPVKKFTAGGISAALWENKASLKDGRQIETLSVTLDRRYKDNDGQWQSSGSMRLNDLPKAIMVLSKAYDYLASTDENTADDTGAYA